MSSAACALLRALLARAGDECDRIFLSSWISTDWQSLTFAGERHQAGFVLSGADPLAFARQWTRGLDEAEFELGANRFVAEIRLCGEPRVREDGSVMVEMEALTLDD